MGLKDIIILKRQELYDQVWSTPMNKLCQLYNLSDNGLRKICKKMDIPTTSSGYWSKLKYNKKVDVIPLPAPNSITILEYILDPEKEKTPLKIPTNLPEIKISDSFRNPHPIIKNTLQYIRDDKSIDRNAALRLRLSKECRKRAMLILNTIFNELEQRKCKVIIERVESYLGGFPAAIVDDVSVHFELRELANMRKDVPIPWGEDRYIYNGILQFKLQGYYKDRVRITYSDGLKHKLEDYLPAIINSIMVALDDEKELRIREAARRKEEERLRVIRETEEKKIVEEKRKFGILQEMATQLTTYHAIQILISQIRHKYENELSPNIKLYDWLNWAEQTNENNNPIDSLLFLSKFDKQNPY